MAYIDDPSNVSPQQRIAVVHPGRFFLTACPGSGKTRTVGIRLALWSAIVDESLGRTRRVAATSYTNTAVRQMMAAADRAGHPVGDPQFAGTLHRFLLRYVVRPFGRRFMGCDQPPRVIASPGGRPETVKFKLGYSKPVDIPIWDFEWRADGSLSLHETPFALRSKITADELSAKLAGPASNAKLALARRGLLSMSDVLYWAMRALEDDEVATTVAARFDELIIDEAQDTSDVQQRCIEMINGAGLMSLVFVGDLHQSIYGFAHADPKKLETLIASTTGATLELNENWRSSQALCDVTYQFSGRSKPDVAVGPHRDAGHPPELLIYPGDDTPAAVAIFVERLAVAGIDAKEGLVLCRWLTTTERLSGVEVSLGRGFRTLVAGAVAAQGDGAIEREVIQEVERLVMSLVDPDCDLDELSPTQRLDLRLGVLKLLKALPAFDLECKSWAKQARTLLTTLAEELSGATILNAGSKVRAPVGGGDFVLADIVGALPAAPSVRTIHSVKGESHAATLLVAVDSQHLGANWESWLGAGDPEEVRVAYVALTRAQRYSALALPDACPADVVNEFLARGFVLGMRAEHERDVSLALNRQDIVPQIHQGDHRHDIVPARQVWDR
jgi:superfamily I DNA/RNA helicase